MNEAEFFELQTYHMVLGTVGAVVILANWIPRFFSRREPASSGLLILLGMLAFAVIPGLPNVPDPREYPRLWELVAELTVIIALFATGLRIDNLSSLTQWGPTIRLLAITMPLTILAVGLLGYAVNGMTLAGAILLGAVMAPTDPVLAGDVQVGPPLEGGEHPVRFALTTEAALNDGLAFPFVYFGLLVAMYGFTPGDWAWDWIARDILWRIGIGAAMGAVGGWALGHVLFAVPRHAPLAETATGVVALAGVLLCYGTTELVEGYGFIAVAVAGLTVRRIEADHDYHRRLHNFTESIENALTALLLVAVGAVLPEILGGLTLAGAAVALVLILLIRPATGWLALRGTDLTSRERNVVALYGVRGVGSIYYLAYAVGKVDFLNNDELWALVGFTILLSTLLHGFTAGIAVDRLEENGTHES